MPVSHQHAPVDAWSFLEDDSLDDEFFDNESLDLDDDPRGAGLLPANFWDADQIARRDAIAARCCGAAPGDPRTDTAFINAIALRARLRKEPACS